MTANIPAFRAWKSETERFLIKKFGKSSFEYQDFLKTSFKPSAWVTDYELIGACKNGLIATKMVFKSYLEELEEEPVAYPAQTLSYSTNRVFIVHGRDGELKHAVARLVEKQGVTAIILSEQANKGKTIIEKFEENSDVSGAICLFTADDLGRTKTDTEEQPRARQNVVFEAGYFMGMLVKMLRKQITEYGKTNQMAAKKYQEMLEETIKQYHERRKHLTAEEAGEAQEQTSEEIIRNATEQAL